MAPFKRIVNLSAFYNGGDESFGSTAVENIIIRILIAQGRLPPMQAFRFRLM